jgi:hypothetical protein
MTEERLGGASCHTHIAMDAKAFIDHHNSLRSHTEGLSGADFYASLTLITGIYLDAIGIFGDHYARFSFLLKVQI